MGSTSLGARIEGPLLGLPGLDRLLLWLGLLGLEVSVPLAEAIEDLEALFFVLLMMLAAEAEVEAVAGMLEGKMEGEGEGSDEKEVVEASSPSSLDKLSSWLSRLSCSIYSMG